MKIKSIILILLFVLVLVLSVFYDQSIDHKSSAGAGDMWWVDVLDVYESK